jgi:ribosomal protein S18 acetylase RimI-like enzyme
MKNALVLRNIRLSDCEPIHLAFKEQNWNKPIAQFLQYVKDQESGIRDVIIADLSGLFAGYLTIRWESDHIPFREKGIPEIVDFNVLKKFQRAGIGTQLMDEAENRISKVTSVAGIGFGVYQDYGAAQILYVKRGYIPDGNGITKNSIPLPHGEVIRIDDELVFFMTKQLTT